MTERDPYLTWNEWVQEIRNDPADELRDRIEDKLKTNMTIDVFSHVIAARSAAKIIVLAHGGKWKPIPGVGGARLGVQRLFVQSIIVFELMTRRRAGLTWGKSYGRPVSGDFFDFANLFKDTLLPRDFRPRTDYAFGKLLERSLKRSGHQPNLRSKRAGRPRKQLEKAKKI